MVIPGLVRVWAIRLPFPALVPINPPEFTTQLKVVPGKTELSPIAVIWLEQMVELAGLIVTRGCGFTTRLKVSDIPKQPAADGRTIICPESTPGPL